jgi:hypothetical protein
MKQCGISGAMGSGRHDVSEPHLQTIHPNDRVVAYI